MRWLVLAGWYAPEKNPRAFRATELVRELKRNGDLVDVFAPDDAKEASDARGVTYKVRAIHPKQGGSAAQEREAGYAKKTIRFLFYFFFGDGPRNVLYGWNLFWALFKHRKHIGSYDTALAISYPFFVLLAFRIFGLLHRVPVVRMADCGDPLYHNPAFPKAFYLKYVEEWVLNWYNYIIVPMTEAKGAYPGLFRKGKLRVIPQGVRLIPIDESLYKPCAIPTFCYAGIFYQSIRNPDYFFDFLAKQTEAFRFIVYALPDPFTRKLLARYQSVLGDRLEVRAPLEREELIAVLARMDFVVNFNNDNSTQRPSKLIDYAMSKRPILSFNRKTFSEKNFMDFLHGHYQAGEHIDPAIYDIRHIARQFKEMR
ncbi:glycosyltransferase [Mitsuokella sp. oral taxon 131]|uniref:glycosyltransferase n=1 Tax=Mitsuokella sp. oral taxon 131 TaxID=1321780 RepID=UPI0004297035|nr:glycosyltransferase [Mitsuokella sp. oral taxon 131]